MKNTVAILFLLTFFISCEEVVDVNLPSIEEKLVVEADILYRNAQNNNVQNIKLSRSTDYFNSQGASPVTTAEVTIFNETSGEVIPFEHTNNGIYTTTGFVFDKTATYRLQINDNTDIYNGTASFKPVPPILTIEQTLTNGFDGEEIIGIDFFVQDDANAENFYYATHQINRETRPYISIWDDKFQNGNTLKIIYREYFSEEEVEIQPSDTIFISFAGISKVYANYMTLLLDQTYSGGDPFATTPVPLKGNIILNNNTQQRALGFFRISEVVDTSYVVQ